MLETDPPPTSTSCVYLGRSRHGTEPQFPHRDSENEGPFLWQGGVYIHLFYSLLIFPFPVNPRTRDLLRRCISTHLMININSTDSSDHLQVTVTPTMHVLF